MRRVLSIVLALVLILSLSVSAFAGAEYTMYIDGSQKLVYEGTELASQSISGRCNTKLYRLLREPSHDRSQFDSMTIVFEDTGDDYYTAKKQVVVGNDGYTYESSNPEAIFIDKAGRFHASGLGESVITVYDNEGTQMDSFTAKASGAEKKPIVEAICSQCGEDMGTSMHILGCSHFVCQGDGVPLDHVSGACGISGHYVCDERDHAQCSNCLGYKCYGEHGVGVCQHVHSWEYAWSSNYWPYWQPGCPMRICKTCHAVEYAWWLLPRPAPAPPAEAPADPPADTPVDPPADTPVDPPVVPPVVPDTDEPATNPDNG